MICWLIARALVSWHHKAQARRVYRSWLPFEDD